MSEMQLLTVSSEADWCVVIKCFFQASRKFCSLSVIPETHISDHSCRHSKQIAVSMRQREIDRQRESKDWTEAAGEWSFDGFSLLS